MQRNVTGKISMPHRQSAPQSLYTPAQKKRRDESGWTLVQGLLAPVQFLVFLVSVFLVIRYLKTGDGFAIATYSVLLKTLLLYLIMVTGAVWEKVVFGKYLFADAFFWEDVVSMVVMLLHTLYLVSWYFNLLSPTSQLLLALAAYSIYVINAAQFIIKLRQARRQSQIMENKSRNHHVNYLQTVSE